MSLQSAIRSSAIGKKVVLPVWRSIYGQKNWVTRNPLLYPAARRKHFERYSRHPELTEMKEILNVIERDGVIAIPDFFDADAVGKMRREVEPYLEQLKNNTYKGPTKVYRADAYGVYRLLEVDTICPATTILFDHPGIWSLAKAYVSPNVQGYHKVAELRPDVGRVGLADHPHIDDWKMRFRSFLYLTDVGSEQAPFTYFLGSHRDAPWRQAVEARYYRTGSNGGYLTPEEQKRILPQYEEKVFTAKAGTLIFADLRGLHRGTPLKQGKRIILVQYFDVR